jgi:hypothetical protein
MPYSTLTIFCTCSWRSSRFREAKNKDACIYACVDFLGRDQGPMFLVTIVVWKRDSL